MKGAFGSVGSFIGEHPMPFMIGGMIANHLFGEKLADKAGVGDFYRGVSPLANDAMMLAGYHAMGESGSMLGTGLRTRAAEGLATWIEGGTGKVGGKLGNLARMSELGVSGAAKFAGKGLAIHQAAMMAIDVNKAGLQALHYFGAVGDTTYKNAGIELSNLSSTVGNAPMALGRTVYGLGEGATNLVRHGKWSSQTQANQGQYWSDVGQNYSDRAGEYGAAWKGRGMNPFGWADAAYTNIGTAFSSLTGASSDQAEKQADAEDVARNQRARQFDRMMYTPIITSDDGDTKDKNGTVTVGKEKLFAQLLAKVQKDQTGAMGSAKNQEAINKIMDSRASNYDMISDSQGKNLEILGDQMRIDDPRAYEQLMIVHTKKRMAQIFEASGIKVTEERMNLLARLASKQGGSMTPAGLLELAGANNIDATAGTLGSEKLRRDQKNGTAVDYFKTLTDAIESGTNTESLRASIANSNRDDKTFSQSITEFQASLREKQELTGPSKRHAGGVAKGETIIQTGDQSDEIAVINPRRTAGIFKNMDTIAKMSSEGPDTMGMDARQFAGLSETNTGGNSNVTHGGNLTLNLGDGVHNLMQQMVAMMAKASAGAGVQVGDKVYRSLVGKK